MDESLKTVKWRLLRCIGYQKLGKRKKILRFKEKPIFAAELVMGTLRRGYIIIFIILGILARGYCSSRGDGFNVSHLLMHHVMDTHDWHITDIPVGRDSSGNWRYVSVAIHFPYLLYDGEKGLVFFFPQGHSEEERHLDIQKRGYKVDEYGRIVGALDSNRLVLDLSLTKTPFQMILVGLIALFLFLSAAKRYGGNPSAPKGLQSFLEPIIVFIREDIAKTYLHAKADRFLPYLLTLFFIIWFSNLLGLTPFNFNIMGNISVTAALAVLTFILTQVNGTKDYWQHIFWYPGVHPLVRIILTPVEILGLFTKPFALAVRLFANITGGHFMILSLISMIFILNHSYHLKGTLGIMPISFLFGLVIFTIETLVAIIQAYIFTLLTAVFVGSAMESHHGDENH